ncbi:hypothetical protein [Aquibacillus sediminis]|uniref:hypothetical protein n=1 Tax=Aquibacillus sediminis TaxID=2574734 RepID=UPI001109D572|nr:hypothetical protein [Aquibacillus sediminis]
MRKYAYYYIAAILTRLNKRGYRGELEIGTKQLLKLMFLLFVISLLLLGCSNKHTNLEEVEGDGLTYSEYFKPYDRLDERENMTYYKPLPIDEIESSLQGQIKKTVNKIDSESLPFKVEEEKAYHVTSKNEDGTARNQIQLSYLSKSDYDRVDDFLIITVTEAEQTPLEENDISNEYDSVGNKLKKEILTEDIPIYQQVITTNSALVYSYYDYDETENRIATVATAANEMYAYYNGYIYHIGYLIDKEKNNEKMQEDMLQLTREYILGDSL